MGQIHQQLSWNLFVLSDKVATKDDFEEALDDTFSQNNSFFTEQIKDRRYPTIVSEFTGDILLVGINYNKKTKRHECHIKKWEKTQGVAGENSCSNTENSSSKRENSRSIKEEKIVGFCSEPKSLEEIAAFMGVKDKNFMKKMYIDPILGTRLRMTEPDSLTSPTQKYVRILDGSA